ncbi:MAG: hypothetical protein OEY36_11545 [Gammaproteobacteria bacterium]|nr:hypothetical protein [Gammaproteobacteria bacterium]
MSQNSEQQRLLSEAYQSAKAADNMIVPMAKTDVIILQAAAQAVATAGFKQKRFMLPLSAAASILIVAGVVLKIAVFSNDPALSSAVTVNKKQPMYMLQRSKHSAEEIMLQQINLLLDQGESAQARSLYKKFLDLYPHYDVSAGLREKLQ